MSFKQYLALFAGSAVLFAILTAYALRTRVEPQKEKTPQEFAVRQFCREDSNHSLITAELATKGFLYTGILNHNGFNCSYVLFTRWGHSKEK